jgi:hypothetical protein
MIILAHSGVWSSAPRSPYFFVHLAVVLAPSWDCTQANHALGLGEINA